MLEDPWEEVPDYVYSRTDDPVAAPDTPEEITVDFKRGDAVAVNGEALARRRCWPSSTSSASATASAASTWSRTASSG